MAESSKRQWPLFLEEIILLAASGLGAIVLLSQFLHVGAEAPDTQEALHRLAGVKDTWASNWPAAAALAITGCSLFLSGAVLLIRYLLLRSRGVDTLPSLPQVRCSWRLTDAAKVLLAAYGLALVISEIPLRPSGSAFARHGLDRTFLLNLVLLGLVLYVGIFRRKAAPDDLGFAQAKSKSVWVTGAMLFLMSVPALTLGEVASFWLAHALGHPPRLHPVIRVLLEGNATTVASAVFLAVVVGPFVEELFWRGFAYPAARRRLGPYPAALVTSAIFASMHMDIPSFLWLFLLSLILCFAYNRTGSVLSAFVVHAGTNLTSTVLVLVIRLGWLS